VERRAEVRDGRPASCATSRDRTDVLIRDFLENTCRSPSVAHMMRRAQLCDVVGLSTSGQLAGAP